MEIDKDLIATADAKLGRTQYQTIVNSSNHTLIADEPHEEGGMDAGMSPYGLLLASLASCTVITLRMYINRKMWAIDDIIVNLELSRTEKGVQIDSMLSFTGEINDEQRKKLIIIADACPIHKILEGNIQIYTALQ